MRKFLLIFVTLFAYGCGPYPQLPNYRDMDTDESELDPVIILVPALVPLPATTPETLSGIYEVTLREIENTCSPDDEEEDIIGMQLWMTVITQNKNEDGSLSVNINLGGLAWYGVDVAPDGTFEDTETLSEEAIGDISGILTPEDVVALITVNLSDTETDFQCRIVYEIEGNLLFERASTEEEYDEDEENNSISGIYETQVTQMQNTCDGSTPWRVTTWANVMLTEKLEDGSFLVNMSLDLWIVSISVRNLFVDADGIISSGSLNIALIGELTLNHLNLFVNFDIITETRRCSIVFDVKGYPIIERVQRTYFEK
ncbi:MAG: hypothetical protein HQ536_00830 [Parcubacteria group bacterium]|nr:hypothetical protein [Parcubacteria group bacterium]